MRPFPDVEGGLWQVSTAGGQHPLWAPDGRELFYVVADGLMEVTVQADATFTPGNPEVQFAGDYYFENFRVYDIAPDGQRFLMIKESGGAEDTSAAASLILVQNWFEELRQRVPVP